MCDQQPPNDERRFEAFKLLHEMVLKHEELFGRWVKFLMGLEAAVVIAFWSVLTFGGDRSGVLLWLIVLFGIVGAVMVLAIIYRVRQWTGWFIKQIREHQKAFGPKIYPAGESDPQVFIRWLGAFPGWVLDCAFGVGKDKNQSGESDPLPTGRGVIFNLIAGLVVVFTFLLLLAGWVAECNILKGRVTIPKPTVVETSSFFTNSVHYVTNYVAGATNVIEISDVTIVTVVK